MKRILMAFSFILALGAALFTKAGANPLADRFYQADPAHRVATCVPINCNLDGTEACDLVDPGFSTYISTGSQPACNTLTALTKIP